MLTHLMSIVCMYFGTKAITNDRIIASYTTSMVTTGRVVYGYMTNEITPTVIDYYGGLLVCYYLYDLLLYIVTDTSGRCRGIAHHSVTLVLILLHLSEWLPIAIGLYYIILFEYSNIFLLLFQLCNEKHWIRMRNIVSIPFVVTYVPIRLIVIPIYSLKYVTVLSSMPYVYAFCCLLLLLFVDVFSIYFSVIIVYKFYQFTRTTKDTQMKTIK
jgi:hypothetical protein